jgi:23S rRNA (guanosine2251-2'-O)-methyltransferase
VLFLVMFKLVSSGDKGSFFILKILLSLVKNPFFIILDNLQDSYNIGSCIRTADSAGATAVIISGTTTCGLSEHVVKNSCMAIRNIPVLTIKNIGKVILFLRYYNILLYGAVVDGPTTLYNTCFRRGFALIFGFEGYGLGIAVKRKCDDLVSIPMFGSTNSLNGACCASIFLYEAVRQRFFH